MNPLHEINLNPTTLDEADEARNALSLQQSDVERRIREINARMEDDGEDHRTAEAERSKALAELDTIVARLREVKAQRRKLARENRNRPKEAVKDYGAFMENPRAAKAARLKELLAEASAIIDDLFKE